MNYPNLMVTNGGQIMDANDSIVVAQQTRNQPPMVVDLNPDLCYQVGGFSNGQKKLCVQNTDIMPAISRGARAAIQVSNSLLICTVSRWDRIPEVKR